MTRIVIIIILSLATYGCQGSNETAQTGTDDTSSDGDQTEGDQTEEEESEGESPSEDLPSPWHCNPVTDPCPDGEKCTIVYGASQSDSKCVPIHEDPVALGEACELLGDGIDNCPDHAACLGGKCVGLCDEVSGLGCPEGQLCGWHDNTNATAYCHVRCHPVDGPGCEPDEICVSSNAIPGFECVGGGAGLGEGEICDSEFDCAAGLACVTVHQESLCRAFCSLLDPDEGGCTGGDVCLPWYGEIWVAPPGYEHVGVCRPPWD